MIIGTTLIHDGTGTTPFYSPSFPRGGLAALFSVDVTHRAAAGANTFDILVEHKNSEDTTWTTVGTFTGIVAVGTASLDVTGIKEEVRLSFAFSAGAVGDFLHIVVPAPSWRPYP